VAKVRAINLVVGERSGVVEDSLRFCFDLLAPGTSAEGARLNLRRVAPRLRCPACADEYEPSFDEFGFACPRCESPGELVDDASDVVIESLEVET
jgi:hydrogenase nickel incorporation protein HypA/HybF